MNSFVHDINQLEERVQAVKHALAVEQKLHAQCRDELHATALKLAASHKDKLALDVALTTTQVREKLEKLEKKLENYFSLSLLSLRSAQTQASIVAKQLEQARDDLKHSKSENEKLRQVYAREIAQTKQQRAELVQQVDELNARWRNVHHFASPEDDALEQWANKVERANQIYERTLVSALKAKISDQAVVDDIVNAFQTLLLQHVEAMSATSAAAAAAATGPDAN